MSSRYSASHVYGVFMRKRSLCHNVGGLIAQLDSAEDADALAAARELAVVLKAAGADLPALGEWVVAVAGPTWQPPLYDMVYWCTADSNRAKTNQDDFAFMFQMTGALRSGKSVGAAAEHRIHSIFLRLGGDLDTVPPSRH